MGYMLSTYLIGDDQSQSQKHDPSTAGLPSSCGKAALCNDVCENHPRARHD